MPDLTIYIDISGRATNGTEHGGHLTAVAVAIEDAQLESILSKIPANFPKWGNAGPIERRLAIDLLTHFGVYIGIHSVDRNTPEWRALVQDSETVQDAIRKQKGKVLGAVKATNILRLYLLSIASILAITRACHDDGVIPSSEGPHELNCRIICDDELSGIEIQEIFRGIFIKGPRAEHGLASAGINLNYYEVLLLSEQQDRLLLLPDYAAGICQAAAANHSSKTQSVSLRRAQRLYGEIVKSGRFTLREEPFSLNLETILGDLVAQSKEFLGKDRG